MSWRSPEGWEPRGAPDFRGGSGFRCAHGEFGTSGRILLEPEVKTGQSWSRDLQVLCPRAALHVDVVSPESHLPPGPLQVAWSPPYRTAPCVRFQGPVLPLLCTTLPSCDVRGGVDTHGLMNSTVR